MPIRPIACLLVLLTCTWAAAREPMISELHGGRWFEIATPATTEPAAVDNTLIRIEDMIQQGRAKDAFKSVVVWLKTHPGSPLRDRGVYLAGEALFQYGDRVKSFFYFDELLDEFPESTLYYQALERQYAIGDAFLNGYKMRIFRFFKVTAHEEGVEILFRIQSRSPGSALAERALLRTADYYYANTDYDLAADAYGAYVKGYPRSLMVPRVKLRQAYANLAQFKGLRFDATPVVNAKAQLQDVRNLYPDLASEEDIPAILGRIDRTFARKLEVTADYYRRTHQSGAAAYTIGVLNKRYPNFYNIAPLDVATATTQPTP